MATPNSTLQPVAERGWRRGLGNLWGNENNLHWGGRRWLVPALVWLVILNGTVFLAAIGEAQNGQQTSAQIAQDCVGVFISIALLATATGAVIGAQGAIIREKQLGTAAWVLSKPAARSAFVLAKLFAHALALVVLALAVPSVAFFLQSQLLWRQAPAVLPFLGSWLILVLSLLFYLSLTLMLGTFLNTRGPVAALGFGFLGAGSLLPNFLPQWVALIFPWTFSSLGTTLALGQPLPPAWPIPIVATALWAVVFISVALYRFGREEF